MNSLLRYSDRPSAGDWADVLVDFPLFSDVSKRRLRKLVQNATFAEFAAGDTVTANGATSDCLYVILSGEAKAVRRPAARALSTGDYFGELALIDGAPRSATVVATRQLHVMQLPSQPVLRLVREHPAVMFRMLKNLSTQLRRVEAQVA
jgi:CRP-like cAMP-binding protein